MRRWMTAALSVAWAATGMFAFIGCSASGGPETAGGNAAGDGMVAASGSGGDTASGNTVGGEAATDEAPRPPKDPNAKYQLVSVEVPTMSCPFACWPKVKKTLERQPGVGDVILAPQKEADAIDKPVVIVEATDAFRAEAAFAALTEAGFGGAKLAAQAEPATPAVE